MTVTEVVNWLKFNGYLFTIQRDLPDTLEVYSNKVHSDPDSILILDKDSDYAMGYPPSPDHKLDTNNGN